MCIFVCHLGPNFRPNRWAGITENPWRGDYPKPGDGQQTYYRGDGGAQGRGL